MHALLAYVLHTDIDINHIMREKPITITTEGTDFLDISIEFFFLQLLFISLLQKKHFWLPVVGDFTLFGRRTFRALPDSRPKKDRGSLTIIRTFFSFSLSKKVPDRRLGIHSHSLDRNLWPWKRGQVFRPQEVVSNLSRSEKRSSVVNTVTQDI